MWNNATKGALESPIIGYSPGVFFNIGEFQIISTGQNISDSSVAAHNMYLDILIDGGIIGLVFFLSIIFTIAKKTFGKRSSPVFALMIYIVITGGILGYEKMFGFWFVLILVCAIQKALNANPEMALSDIF
jgi:O-antigen ligase